MLAQTTSSSSIIFWSIMLLVALLLGLVAALRVKRRLTALDVDEPARGGFTLSDLRQLHKSGKMTDEQFEKAKQRIIGTAKTAGPALKPPVNGAGDEPFSTI
jgi:hypothetical protein